MITFRYSGAYTVFSSNDQTTWTQICTGLGTPGVTNIVLPQQITAQYIKISLRVLASTDGTAYEEIARCETGSETTMITFDTIQKAKCIRLELTAAYDTAWWSIYEINLSCSWEEASAARTATTWNHGLLLENRAIDGDISTYWESAETQTVSDSYTTAYLLNLGTVQNVSGIAINTGSQMWSYLDTYEVYAWKDGEEAQLVAKGSAQTAVTEIFFETSEAKYIWIKAGSNVSRPFVIAELDVYL